MKDRLENLKETLHLEWGELAQLLGISRSMLDHVRNGARVFGPKAVRRLEKAEGDAGLRKCAVVHEDSSLYIAESIDSEITRELCDIKAELESLAKRVNAIIRKRAR